MAEATALMIIFTLYIIPLNILFFKFSKSILNFIQLSQNGVIEFVRNIPGISYIINKNPCIGVSVFYVLLVAAYFIILYFVLKHLIFKSIYLYSDKDIDEDNFMKRYRLGQENVNRIAYVLITIAMLLHLIFRVINIRILVFYILAVMFIYNSEKIIKKNRIYQGDTEKQGAETVDIIEETEAETGGRNIIEFKWEYNRDPFKLEQPLRFTAKIAADNERYKEYQGREHSDNSPDALRKYVIDGLCPEVVELAGQIKRICEKKGLTTYHQVSAVMAFQQNMRYVQDMESKGVDEYIRYPLETLLEGEGDCDCHSICTAAILYSMGYEVVLLRIIYPEGEGHLALAVEGANGIKGDFFEFNNKRYFYCEAAPAKDSRITFKVGEMPKMPGANISIIQVKESITKM